ncbi:PIG-L family deacetylase [bacterium]|nr:PIG-L family deacetylase [bacterium]
MKRLRFRRLLRLALTVMSIVATGTLLMALAIQFKIHLANEWQQYNPVTSAQLPKKGDSILVFAPHSDDETLGCAGMIGTAEKAGANVHVALITNGDGFRVAVGRAYKTIKITPQRCIEFAYKRQKETLRALSIMGVGPERVTFFGYPDRGIAKLWDQYWTRDSLYLSRATGSNHSPYTNAFTWRAPYCGDSLLRDVVRLIEECRPTDIYLPHPLDNHQDHYATYCFVTAAVEQLMAEHHDFATKIRVHTYLVHRGDWPVPKGDHSNEPLSPPYALTGGDTKWFSMSLTPEIAERKRRAIKQYRTQTAVEKGFLMSFARGNEIFGSLPDRTIPLVSHSKITVDGNPSDWSSIPPSIVDPVDDYVMAGFNKGGDVRTIYLCRDDKHLYARIDYVGHLSKRISYTLNLRGISDTDSSQWYTISIKPKTKTSSVFTPWAYRNNVLETEIPLDALNLHEDLFVQVTTKLMKMTVDQTGWHGLEFGDGNKVSKAPIKTSSLPSSKAVH